MVTHTKAVIEVKVDIDPIPGWGNNPKDYAELIQKHLNQTIPHYNPEVRLVKTETRR